MRLSIEMNYNEIAEAYEKIETTTKRLEMTDLLVDLIKNTPNEIIDKVIYLTQGKIHPDFVSLEIGIAEKLAMKALVRASGRTESEVKDDLIKTGDIGETARKTIANKKQQTFFQESLTISKVYDTLDKIAKTSGPRAVYLKTVLLAGLISNATPKEAKYLLRTVTGNLRLGIADMTVLDALAIACSGGKEARYSIERAYNVSSDLGRVAKVLAEKGLEGIVKFKVAIFKPIRPMLAERVSSPVEILEKFGGKCIAEYKYDGERMQAHKKGDEVLLFSRRLEDISNQYPDGIELIKSYVKAKDAILEAECVAIDIETGEMRAFQELMHRRRKYEIENAMEQYPISLFVFDVLYVNGKDLTIEPYPVRRKALEKAIKQNNRIRPAKKTIINSVEELEKFFEEAIENGCEGIVCKSMAKSSIYKAGARGGLWIKYKRDYKSEMTDTVDLVVVGAFHGRGKRAGTYGALLLASYNSKRDTFETVTKCGTGFTDEDLAKLPKLMQKHLTKHRHSRVQSMLEADVWFKPDIVLETRGAEITLSPIHTCAMDYIRKGSGLAIRFPRFTGNYRLDKAAEDATSSAEVLETYRSQLKKAS